jgi:hypothetical protein
LAAFVSEWIALYVLVAIMWFVPERLLKVCSPNDSGALQQERSAAVMH